MPRKKQKHKNNKTASKIEKVAKREALAWLRANPDQSYNHKQIASHAGLRGFLTASKLIGVLNRLVAKGQLKIVDRGKYQLNDESADTLEGVLDLTSQGFGFVTVEGYEEEFFIGSRSVRDAMNGDTVAIKVIKPARRGNKAEAKIVKVVERKKSTFVGTIQIVHSQAILIPDDHKIPFEFYVDMADLKEAKAGEKVLARLLDFEDGTPTVEIIKVIGESGANETEMHAILYEFGFDPEFPPGVEAEAEDIPKKISAAEIKRRKDMRGVPTCTIDPADAKDFDDALSFKFLENGNYEVGVHIADVTHYLREGTLLDKEGYNRATSVYLVDRTVPMLPEVLSNNLCSLRPNEDRLAMSAIFEMTPDAKVVKEWFGETVIHSDRRFAYEEAQEVLETGEGDFAEELKILNGMAKIMQERRFKSGSLGFEDTEVKFELDETGKPIRVYKKVRKDAHKLIEDFMLLANKQVPMYLAKLRKEPPLPFVYRIHAAPDEEKLGQLKSFINNFGYDIDLTSVETTTKSLHQLVTEVQGKPESTVIQTVAIRTMSKAVYSPANIGHYGLGFPDYTHFTSPIRRYPDVMVHRLLKRYLEGNFKNYGGLEEKCKHSSGREKRASDAERASVKYKQVEFLSDKVGEEFEGIVSGVTRWGVYVEIIENKCEGMIMLRELPGDFFEFDEENYCVRGRRFGQEIHLGDKVVIKVKSTDLFKRVIDFELVEHLKEDFEGKEGQGKTYETKSLDDALKNLGRSGKKGSSKGRGGKGSGQGRGKGSSKSSGRTKTNQRNSKGKRRK